VSVVELRGRAGQRDTEKWVRDPLASDVDDRLVVHMRVPPVVQRTEATKWPMPRRVRRLPAGWPIAAAVAGWPVWWALGVTNLVFPFFGTFLAVQLFRRGNVKVPPFFWMWALFLLLVVFSGFAIDVDVVGAATSQGIGRYFAFGLRVLNYAAVTVMLLFIGNMTEEELPRRRIIKWMGSLGIVAILLGALSLVLPDFSFVTPSTYFLPGGFRDEGSAVARLSQMQPVLGEASPRPSAPFPFTNAWGNNLSLLLIWIVVGWGVLGNKLKRLAVYGLLLLAVAPIVFSLNRGMWIGIGISLVFVALRLALRGRVRVLAALVLTLAIGSFAFAASPLETMVQARLETGHSNDVRGSLLSTAIDSAKQSPIVGFGTTRKTLGSDASIAIGPSEACPRCGSRNIGSTGQLTLLLISQGFLGVALYFGFLFAIFFRYLRDHSVIGIAGTLVVLLQIVYAGFYSALTMPLAITFLSIGLLWRNDQLRSAVGHHRAATS
jgi:hypothetical protein